MQSQSTNVIPDFNPAKSKVAELRNVLLQNDVVYGAGARKQDLVDLFNEHVKPHAAEKLKELNNVVATEARIEVVKPRTASPVRKSPRKVSSSTDRNKRAVSADLGKIPDLSAAASRTRERSPSRRSPEFEERITRSPRRVGSSKQDTLKKQRSPRKVSSSKTEKIDTKVQAEDEDEGSDVAPVSKEEFEAARPPFKVDTKIESSFSNDNVFQSPTPSSPEFKTNKSIPRKRGSTESPEKTTRKATKPRKKTAFSSSPIAEPMTKSPAKSSLKISKFEDDDESFSEKFAGSSHFPNEADRTVQDVTQIDLEQKYGTPQENYTSHVNIASSPGTPAKTPSKSPYAKASSAIRDSLTSWLNTTPSKHEPALERDAEDPELVENERESISEDADVEDTTVDVLETLQKDIEDTINVVIKESEEAAKQINELFDAEDVVDEDTAPRESLIKWYAVLRFFQQLLTFTILAAIVTAGLWYREQRVLVGYCGNEIYQPLFPHTENIYLEELDNLLQEYKPQCIECPEHAICLPGLKIKCKQDFLVKGPWYKLYDVLPFPDYCVKDQEKENIISEVVAKSLELLRTRNAAVRCGDGDDFEVGISDEELYQFFYNSKRSSVSDEEFSEIWSDVLEDLAREPEINVRQVSQPLYVLVLTKNSATI